MNVDKNNSISKIENVVKMAKGKITFNKLTNATIAALTVGAILTGIHAYNKGQTKKIILDQPIRGCDVSDWQKTFDWDEIEDNFDFIILKATEGNVIQNSFEENYKNAYKHNMKIGIYTMNALGKSNTKNLEDFKNQTEKRFDILLEQLKNKKIDYPVYLDIENTKAVNVSKDLPEEYMIALTDIFYNKMTENGYIPGLYSNQTIYKDNIKRNIINLERFEKWIAGGDSFSIPTKLSDTTSDNKIFNPEIRMVQAYEAVTDAGVKSDSGYVDVDYSYLDYHNKESNTKDIVLSLGELSLAGVILGKKTKNKNNTKTK